MRPNQIPRICGNCSVKFSVRASRVAIGRGLFCSRKCQHDGWRKTAQQRFLSRLVQKNNGCIEYMLDPNEKWYPQVATEDSKRESAHRYAWRIAGGVIPEGLFILHQCDNPRCCNVEHLFIGTHQDNMADKVSKGRQAVREKNGRGKLTREQALHAISLRDQGMTYKKIGSIFGVTGEAIMYIYGTVK